jgi:ribose transport system ATP-binding protein
LSGGTQQKVIIGKWLMTEPEVLLLDDPTKGIDVHTTAEFYEIVKRLCDEGCSIIWNSSEDRELLENTDRILVFNGGEIVDELSGDRLTEFELYKAALTVGGQAAGKV